MTKRIFRAICVVAVAVFAASLMLIMGVLYSYFSDTQIRQLTTEARMCAQGISLEGVSYFEGLETEKDRITWIARDGRVLYDSQADAAHMENHLERDEVQQALSTGYGESVRYSTTLMERQLYVALRMDDGSVVRLAGAQYTIPSLLLSMIQPIIIVVFLAIGISLWLAGSLAKRIVKPLNEVNLDAPDETKIYEELSPLVLRLKFQQAQLKRQESELKRKRDEFDTATLNMNEGLILLNERGAILSINRAASRLLGISSYCIGRDVLLLNNSFEMQELLRRAQGGEHVEMAVPLQDGEYQINASPVVTDGATSGVALLIFDITEKEKAEKMRREFTANVSHELKTPLHTISGCAELLAGGMVKTEDVPKFAGQVYSESRRMIALVEDIIRLSHLDEGAEDMKREDTDLYALSQTAVNSLLPAAQAAGVTLTLTGASAKMRGISQLLGGIVFNLCDNAIKYNHEGGFASVTVENEDDEIVLSVSDNGLGIPDEQQERVFERFYRVDVSHSKEVGGTGLGLSIVKHAARLHNAKIELHSVLGEGTTVVVRFPKS